MTKNQIEYLKHLENVRSNRTKEAETSRANLATEELNRTKIRNDYVLGSMTAQESKRSNLAKEQETYRHNVATERDAANKTAETVRHNVATEKVAVMSANETARHNKASEGLTSYSIGVQAAHNKATEALQAQSIAEAARSNLAQENLAAAAQAETHRANLAREQYQQDQLQISRDLTKSQMFGNYAKGAKDAVGAIDSGYSTISRIGGDILNTMNPLSRVKGILNID